MKYKLVSWRGLNEKPSDSEKKIVTQKLNNLSSSSQYLQQNAGLIERANYWSVLELSANFRPK